MGLLFDQGLNTTDAVKFAGVGIGSTADVVQAVDGTYGGGLEFRPLGVGSTDSLAIFDTAIRLGNLTFNIDQTVGAGQDNYVLTYDNGTGEISLEAAASGNPFDQSLNTTDSPSFANVTITETDTASSGTALSNQITNTYNQTGTAGSTDLLINRTETALGSGTHNFLDFQVGGASQFNIDNSGNVQFGGTLVHVDDNDVEYRQTSTGWHRWYRQDGDHNMLLHPANGLQIKGDYGFGFTSNLNGSDSDVKIWREAAGSLAQRNGTNAQAFRVYNKYTNASNNEGFRIDWQTVSNLCIIGTFKNGTGSSRDIDLFRGSSRAVRWSSGGTKLYGNLRFNGSSFDIGESVTISAPRNIWAQAKVEAPALALVDVSADPSDPANGQSIMWQSDGTGSGDDGDIMMKITDSGGTTKTVTLVDYFAA